MTRPRQDYSKWGKIDTEDLSLIQAAVANLERGATSLEGVGAVRDSVAPSTLPGTIRLHATWLQGWLDAQETGPELVITRPGQAV